jgi:hypothetical protein
VVSFYNLCGKVNIDTTGNEKFSTNKRTIILSEKNKGERRTHTDDNGAFCFEVKPGNYVVIPVVTAEEKEKGLKLLPNEKTV